VERKFSVTGVDLCNDLPNFCSLIMRRGGHTSDQSLMFGVGGRREKLKGMIEKASTTAGVSRKIDQG